MSEEITKINKKLDDHEARILKLERLLQTKPEVIKKKMSIKEFILQKNPKDDVGKALAIGYYLEKFGGLHSFNSKDIEQGFQEAKEKIPSNVADKIYKNIAKGYIMETKEEKDGMKAYVLTNTGEKYVESGIKK